MPHALGYGHGFCPVYVDIVNAIQRFFVIEHWTLLDKVNMYRDGTMMKRWHHDALLNDKPRNCSIIASFGCSRVLAFKARHGEATEITLTNGSLLFFGLGVDRCFFHSILPEVDEGGRISVACWGMASCSQ